MDGDQSAKTFEQGANSAMKDQEFTSGIHESTNQIVSVEVPFFNTTKLTQSQPAAGEKTRGTGTSMFSKDGAVGSMFNGTFHNSIEDLDAPHVVLLAAKFTAC